MRIPAARSDRTLLIPMWTGPNPCVETFDADVRRAAVIPLRVEATAALAHASAMHNTKSGALIALRTSSPCMLLDLLLKLAATASATAMAGATGLSGDSNKAAARLS